MLRRSALVAVPSSTLALVLTLACNSSGSSASSEASTYCQATFSQLQTCGVFNVAPACLSALEAECAEAVESLISPAGLQAEATCFPQVTDCSCYTSGCSDAGLAQSQAAESCIASQLRAVPPSASVQQLEKDFCAACPDGASKAVPNSCSGLDSAPDGGVGPGVVFRAYSDSVVQTLDEQCTGAALASFDAGGAGGGPYDCYEAFVRCMGVVQSNAGAALGGAFKGDAAPAACLGDAFAGPG